MYPGRVVGQVTTCSPGMFRIKFDDGATSCHRLNNNGLSEGEWRFEVLTRRKKVRSHFVHSTLMSFAFLCGLVLHLIILYIP